jgi:pilus assembly protein Flp/PilA
MRKFRGQTLVEYGLIVALVSIAVIVVLIALGGAIVTIFSTVASTLGAHA